MTTDKPIVLKRDCQAALVPSGEPVLLSAGSQVWLTQALGGSYTIMTDRGHTVRIDGRDGDVLGLEVSEQEKLMRQGGVSTGGSVEDLVWRQLRSCFDPEIPVNIVDLGLIYDCKITDRDDGGYSVVVRFTLTAQGCGMGAFLQADIRKKLLALPAVHEAAVDLVWDPPWNQSRLSPTAKQQLGIV